MINLRLVPLLPLSTYALGFTRKSCIAFFVPSQAANIPNSLRLHRHWFALILVFMNCSRFPSAHCTGRC